ncbi:D-threitol dehydrogenase [Candidatus Kirkpatrickella diaphorinae]|uniref:D-threitol dehydrogenase n=1 Tax=Candidatus Kirkpatrickella diaphorinae TaxID=2984322 RepID=A0ABY6GL13_9PROT|nr:D-threitol dehydrogenase [Candidatus Kirkpatrickella diaphorinae]UYH52014.1 D-threitol dehydrogenase [Candidatus Kirkpatrickella diaphorinae]
MISSSTKVDLNFPLIGKTALVTGAGSGIGAAIAEALAEKGAQIAAVDVQRERAEATVRLVGTDAHAFTCDVSSPESVETMVDDVKTMFGHIDILINCAGVVHLAPAEELTVEQWDKTININLKGTFLVTREVGRVMIAQRTGGKIINMASQAGSVAIAEHVAYCASKFGVIGMSKTFAAEWGRHGITVNTISPTIVMTELGKKAWAGEKGEAAKQQIPVGRFAEPSEIAAAVLFLASRGADMINGADLLIDGGYTII